MDIDQLMANVFADEPEAQGLVPELEVQNSLLISEPSIED